MCNELLKKITYKEGRAPAALAEGFRRAYEVFGEESKWYAFEVHGCAAGTYDVRNKYAGKIIPIIRILRNMTIDYPQLAVHNVR